MSRGLKIRRARMTDVSAIARIDQIARTDTSRREFIRKSVAEGNCWVVAAGREVIAYGGLDFTFYGNGFVSMLYVAATHRRHGLGTALLRHLESKCRTPKLFTSTNRSNKVSQALLSKLGYAPSGVIHNLDEGDPELIYFKRLS